MKTNISHFPLASIIPFFIGGILFSYYFITKEAVSIIAIEVLTLTVGLLCLASFFIHHKRKAISVVILYFFSFCLGLSNQLLHEPYFTARHYILQPFGKAQHTLIVIRERLKPTVKNLRYYALVRQIDEKESNGTVALYIKREGLAKIPKVGDVISVADAITLHRKPSNPGQFDYGKYLSDKHILGSIYTRQSNFTIRKMPQKDLWYYAERIRSKIFLQFKDKGLDNDDLAVVMALILGQQQDISEATVHDYQAAGAVHILSVSGLHIGFLMLFVQFLFSGLPNSKRWNVVRFCIIITLLWSFAFLSGLSPSVVRSVTMFSFVAVGRLLQKETNIYNTLLISLFFILNVEPAFLFDAGFQLSYISLFFIVWLQPILSKALSVKNKIGQYIIDILSVSFAAQLGVLPLSVYYFHQFSGLFFITNLIILPGMGIIMALGTVATLLAALGCVPGILVKLLGLIIHLLNLIVEKIAGFTDFVLQDISLSKIMMLASYTVIFTAILMIKRHQFRYYAAFLSSILIWNICLFSEDYKRQNEEVLIVFQQPRETLLGFKKGNTIDFYSSNFSTVKNAKQYVLTNGIKNSGLHPLKNIYSFKDKNIKLIDSTGIFSTGDKPDILILSGSPKFNLDRYLLNHSPAIIISDGSDYKSYAALWKSTCLKRKIPFHATAEKGFYMME